MYSPRALPPKVGGISTDGNFLIIKKIPLKKLEEILDAFEF